MYRYQILRFRKQFAISVVKKPINSVLFLNPRFDPLQLPPLKSNLRTEYISFARSKVMSFIRICAIKRDYI